MSQIVGSISMIPPEPLTMERLSALWRDFHRSFPDLTTVSFRSEPERELESGEVILVVAGNHRQFDFWWRQQTDEVARAARYVSDPRHLDGYRREEIARVELVGEWYDSPVVRDRRSWARLGHLGLLLPASVSKKCRHIRPILIPCTAKRAAVE